MVKSSIVKQPRALAGLASSPCPIAFGGCRAVVEVAGQIACDLAGLAWSWLRRIAESESDHDLLKHLTLPIMSASEQQRRGRPIGKLQGDFAYNAQSHGVAAGSTRALNVKQRPYLN